MKLQDLDEELEEVLEDSEEQEEEALSFAEMVLWQKIVIFAVLFVIAAVIATILWNLTPKGGGSGMEPGESQIVQAPVSTQLPTEEPTTVPTEQLTPEPTVAPTGEPVPDGADNQESENVTTREPVPGSGAEAVADAQGFVEIADSVTPKDVINLRSEPSTAGDANIVTQAVNGQVLNRIGVNSDTGWSKIDYEGQILYAVSQYLTTDLSYQGPAEVSDPNRVSTKDGRTIVFTECDDWITPKEYVNLRLEPSTSEGNATVHCRLNYGEKVHRTGYSADSGWSRVEYDGLVLYVVSSYMYQVESQ